MAFSDIIKKLADASEVLNPQEKQELYLQARQLEQVASIATQLILPGSGTFKMDNAFINDAKINDATIHTASIDGATVDNATINGATINNATIDTATITDASMTNATISNGDVTIQNNSIAIDVVSGLNTGTIAIDSRGIVLDNAAGNVWFKNGSGSLKMRVQGSTNDDLVIEQQTVGAMISLEAVTTGSNTYAFRLYGDSASHGLATVSQVPANGSRFALGDYANYNSAINIDVGGASAGATDIQMYPTPRTPSNPSSSTEANIYIKNGNLVIQYNDAGTVRYKYLNLTGTGVTWTHSTTAP